MSGSWKTTLGGMLTAGGLALMGAPEWVKPAHAYWLKIAGYLCTIAGPLILGLTARDNDKRSEDVGAGPPATDIPGDAVRTMERHTITPKLPLLLLVAAMALPLAGCGTFTVAPGADPLVVYAEASAETALDTFKIFLKWERDNEAVALKIDPKIHATAEEIRRNGLIWIGELRTATRTYKAARTEDNAGKLRAAQQFLEFALGEVRIYYNYGTR